MKRMIHDDDGVAFYAITPRGAAYLAIALSLLLAAAAAFNIYLWNDSRSTRAELAGERAARLTQREQDERQGRIGKVSNCTQSIHTIAIANVILEDLRKDHLQRARQAESLATIDPTKKLRKAHELIARQQRAKAELLQDFPPVTRKQCAALAKKLGVPLPRPTTTTPGGSQ